MDCRSSAKASWVTRCSTSCVSCRSSATWPQIARAKDFGKGGGVVASAFSGSLGPFTLPSAQNQTAGLNKHHQRCNFCFPPVLRCVGCFSRKHGEGFFRWVHLSSHESHYKVSLQGIIIRVIARSHCKESLQGVISTRVITRCHCKESSSESLQGVIARSHCKESFQGVIARSH